MTTVAPITERRGRVTLREASRNGRRRALGKVSFSYDGSTLTARRQSTTVYSGVVTAAESTGTERWRFTLENGDIAEVVIGCGCGG